MLLLMSFPIVHETGANLYIQRNLKICLKEYNNFQPYRHIICVKFSNICIGYMYCHGYAWYMANLIV